MSFKISLRHTCCCVEAECHFCYLRDSSVYVHECCCVGVQRHLPTYMKRRKCQDGPETYMQQRWCLISVTKIDWSIAIKAVRNCFLCSILYTYPQVCRLS